MPSALKVMVYSDNGHPAQIMLALGRQAVAGTARVQYVRGRYQPDAHSHRRAGGSRLILDGEASPAGGWACRQLRTSCTRARRSWSSWRAAGRLAGDLVQADGSSHNRWIPILSPRWSPTFSGPGDSEPHLTSRRPSIGRAAREPVIAGETPRRCRGQFHLLRRSRLPGRRLQS